ncbi:hypothetical protein RZ760_017390 [Providencia rettgeri]|nr:hypothetical protein [Providencia rettgeri]
MDQHNNLHPLLQTGIFLAPGSYFHVEYSHIYYHELPKTLQKFHNQRLIRQYCLPWPNATTSLLPESIAHEWCQLPKVALGLGLILHTGPLPWWGELAIYTELREQFSDPLWQIKHTETPTPQTLLALGAEQLFAYITPFGREYKERLKYMFSNEVLQLIPSSTKTILPWNIVEETCHYVRKNIA